MASLPQTVIQAGNPTLPPFGPAESLVGAGMDPTYLTTLKQVNHRGD